MHRLSLAASFLTIAVLSTSAAAGQRIDDRRGFWLAGAVSGSSVEINCIQYCPAGRKLGISGFVQAGGMPSAKTLAGMELNGWRASDSEAAREYIAVLGMGHYYPALTVPLYLKFGLGAGRYGEEKGENQMSATGFVIQLGVGYEFAVTRSIWVAPFAHYMVAPNLNAKRNRFGLSTDFNLNALQLGGRVAWH